MSRPIQNNISCSPDALKYVYSMLETQQIERLATHWETQLSERMRLLRKEGAERGWYNALTEVSDVVLRVVQVLKQTSDNNTELESFEAYIEALKITSEKEREQVLDQLEIVGPHTWQETIIYADLSTKDVEAFESWLAQAHTIQNGGYKQPKKDTRIGAQVRHKAFGLGTVESIQEDKVTILFGEQRKYIRLDFVEFI